MTDSFAFFWASLLDITFIYDSGIFKVANQLRALLFFSPIKTRHDDDTGRSGAHDNGIN